MQKETYEIEVVDIYLNGGYGKEVYGGISVNVINEKGNIVAVVDEEESFQYSDYKQMVWMDELNPIVDDLVSQANDESIRPAVRKTIKQAITDATISMWYSEPDYVQGWDDVEVIV